MTQSSLPALKPTASALSTCLGDGLWGAQTARSLRCFALGEQRMLLAIVDALAQVKRGAAEVNADVGLLGPARVATVAAAATRIATVELAAQLPLLVQQTGSGSQSHINVDEVIAHLAALSLVSTDDGPGAGHRVHPNDDVNVGQRARALVANWLMGGRRAGAAHRL